MTAHTTRRMRFMVGLVLLVMLLLVTTPTAATRFGPNPPAEDPVPATTLLLAPAPPLPAPEVPPGVPPGPPLDDTWATYAWHWA